MKTKKKRKAQKMLKLIAKYFDQWKKLNAKTKEQMKKIFIYTLCTIVAVQFVACNATRTITTTQTHIKGQDTVVTMTTKTTESYDAKINPKNF